MTVRSLFVDELVAVGEAAIQSNEIEYIITH